MVERSKLILEPAAFPRLVERCGQGQTVCSAGQSQRIGQAGFSRRQRRVGYRAIVRMLVCLFLKRLPLSFSSAGCFQKSLSLARAIQGVRIGLQT